MDEPASPPRLTVRAADLDDPRDGAAVVELLDAYARDPFGISRPLPDAVRATLVEKLKGVPQTWIAVARLDEAPAGVAICFLGFSTFRARPLLNVHDFAVVPSARGRGVGKALMDAVMAEARARGCCKVTLEVRSDNETAKRLYRSAGFATYEPLAEASFEFWSRELD